MKRTPMLLSALAAGLFTLSMAHAEPPYPGPGDMAMNDDPMAGALPPPRMRMRPPRPPAAPRFPSPRELAKMVPPEPVSEDMIRERFAKRREELKEMLNEDRQAAEKYAQDFAHYQKQQAETLAKIMARAEKRREAMIKRLEERETQVLERYRQRHQADSEPSGNPGDAQ